MQNFEQPDALISILESAFMRSLSLVPQMTRTQFGVMIAFGAASQWNIGHQPRGKLLFFGVPDDGLLSTLGLQRNLALPPLTECDHCIPAAGDIPHTESTAFLTYADHPLHAGLAPHMHRRPFVRFDYADEWNNLGFGSIRTDGSIWSASGGYVPDGAVELAAQHIQEVAGQAYAGSYLTLFDTPDTSVLWCARPVGLVDSTEWSIIERFVSDWRADALPCLPVLRQTPAGCRCLVTMRLDCDENIASARSLFEQYANANIPFSLAVKTSLPMRTDDLALLNDVRTGGGSLLSHTHTHQMHWGPSYEDVLLEAENSRQWFRRTWPDTPPPDIAVSPFHTNPPYAVQAIAKAGFTGFVSGIIHNDPEYLLGRAGMVPFADGSIVSISQQSMLHGDCYRRQNFSIETHIQAFAAQYTANGIFGYLDHPFSDRYQYDWDSEVQRLSAHSKFVSALRAYEDVWFWNQQDCFIFIQSLAKLRLHVPHEGAVLVQGHSDTRLRFIYRYKGEEYLIA